MSVNYNYISPDGPERDSEHHARACFSSINYLTVEQMPRVIQYLANARNTEHSMFWIEFIGEWLDEDKFIAFPDETDPHLVEFWLDCEGMSNRQALLYLTAFRYVDEYSMLVGKLYDYHKLTGASANELFMLMCGIHERGEEGGYGAGHSLSSNYSAYLPGYLTIEEFYTERLDELNDKVHRYFRASDKPKPSILDQIVDPCF